MTEDLSQMYHCSQETTLIAQGAEARLYSCTYLGRPAILKERFSKSYRHPDLDIRLTKGRLKAEVRGLQRCRSMGLPVPSIYFVDTSQSYVVMSFVTDGRPLRLLMNQKEKKDDKELATALGWTLSKMHEGDLVHGDLTTSNILVQGGQVVEKRRVVLIDFGLSFVSSSCEDKAVDLYVLEKTFVSSHPERSDFFQLILQSYAASGGKKGAQVLDKMHEVRSRGRKRTMVG